MKKYSLEFVVGIFVLVGLICVAYLTVKLGKMEMFSSKGYMVTAKFSSITGLRVGAAVELSGVQVGKVTGISLYESLPPGVAAGYAGPVNYRAEVTMQLQEGLVLADDSIASVKTSGLIGDKYISLSVGGSPDLIEQGGEITETESTVDLESLISKYAFGDMKK